MLLINNDDAQKVLTIEDPLRVLEDGRRELAKHEGCSSSRSAPSSTIG